MGEPPAWVDGSAPPCSRSTVSSGRRGEGEVKRPRMHLWASDGRTQWPHRRSRCQWAGHARCTQWGPLGLSTAGSWAAPLRVRPSCPVWRGASKRQLCFFSNIYLFWLCWVLVVAYGIFSCGMWDLWLQYADFLVAACLWDLVPRPGIEPGPPALGAQSLTHWTTREVPQ